MIYVINPLQDRRWDELVDRHPQASVFHQRGWLEALIRTYRYEPFALTTTPPGESLRNGIVLCRIESWLTGARLVSLPFADHCEVLASDLSDYKHFIGWLIAECDRRGYRYVELRSLSVPQAAQNYLRCDRSYCFHELDLTPSVEQLFRSLHRDSIQRRIRRAENAQLSYEQGRSERLVSEFYRLMVMTRRRHYLPPQPRIWFNNLIECMGRRAELKVVRNNGVAIAAMLTLQHRSCIVYKYGCSDEKFHQLGGMPFLFWRLIKESKASGVERIDLGRSDLDTPGLIAFKDRFGGIRRPLTYYRYAQSSSLSVVGRTGKRAMKQLFSVLPRDVLPIVGKLLYRHMG